MKYTASKEDYQKAVANSISIADVARNLGIVAAGGNYSTIRRNIAKHEIDTSHFHRTTGSSWNKGVYSTKPISKTAIKNKVVRERGYKCQGENCGITDWHGKPISLELEHIDGNPSNNEDENLLLLCPNCHSQTPTWRRGKLSAIRNGRLCIECGNEVRSDVHKKCTKCRAPEKSHQYRQAKRLLNAETPKTRKPRIPKTPPLPKFCACGTELAGSNTKGVCLKCSHVAQQRIVWPSVEELQERLKTTSFVQLGKQLGVSDNAIRKYLRNNSERATSPSALCN